MSLPRLAVAEPCDGEQLPALLSGLENVRCDTAAAAEGQADKEWAWERVWSEGRGCLQTLSSPLRGKGLRREPRSAGSAALRAPPAPCLASLGACVYFQPRGEKRRVRGWVPHFPQSSWGPVHATSEGSLRASHGGTRGAWGTRRLRLGGPVGSGSQLCCCSDPARPQGQGPCLGVPVTAGRAGAWGSAACHPTSSRPARGCAASRLFGRCTVRVALPRAPRCLPVNL